MAPDQASAPESVDLLNGIKEFEQRSSIKINFKFFSNAIFSIFKVILLWCEEPAFMTKCWFNIMNPLRGLFLSHIHTCYNCETSTRCLLNTFLSC